MITEYPISNRHRAAPRGSRPIFNLFDQISDLPSFLQLQTLDVQS